MSEIDWSRYNLPAIASLIDDIDVCDGADRVLGWDNLSQAVRDQHQRLMTAAAELDKVWPAAKNGSAKKFSDAVGVLADNMNQTVTAAEKTKSGLNGIVEAIGTAQQKVRDLGQGRQAVASDWMPRFIDHAEDGYDQNAQVAMREAEAAIQDHNSSIQTPPLFNMNVSQTDDPLKHLQPGGGATSFGGNSGGSLQANPQPVPIHSDPSGVFPDSPAKFDSPGGGTGGLGDGTGGTGSHQGDGSGQLGSGIGPSSQGPTLSGVGLPVPGGGAPGFPGTGNLPNPPLMTGPNGGSSLGLPPGGLPGGGLGVPGVLPMGGGSGGFGGAAGGFLPGGLSGGLGGAVRSPVSVRRAMPSGAVIGEGGQLEPGGSRSGAAGGGAASTMPFGAGGRGGGRRGSEYGVDGEADQQWQADEGVAPVIKPDTTKDRHDPGPGVIGFYR